MSNLMAKIAHTSKFTAGTTVRATAPVTRFSLARIPPPRSGGGIHTPSFLVRSFLFGRRLLARWLCLGLATRSIFLCLHWLQLMQERAISARAFTFLEGIAIFVGG